MRGEKCVFTRWPQRAARVSIYSRKGWVNMGEAIDVVGLARYGRRETVSVRHVHRHGWQETQSVFKGLT
ncbi:hypothetical protein GCM10010990_29230 [Croceicoccus mobilis]|uniref:Uncharacterized protein n=1 Tax=Croceicoccus mobilis TaxID=1703339 RepID=A0A916Z743_9SPHN|nr:hypothetical protein GCM10010990_29230 [Croceicoccus mobilis]